MIFWNWGIWMVIGTAVLLYGIGWWRQPSPGPRSLPTPFWQGFSFFIALLILTLALFSPIHDLATQYFYIHALQRLLLVAVVPALCFSGDPMPILLAGLPAKLQVELRQLPHSAPRLCNLFTQFTSPVLVWFLFVSTFWLWHDKQVNQLLLQTEWLHRLENVTLLGTAVCYWWHIMAASPRLHRAMPLLWRGAYAALGATPIKLVGFVLMFTSTAVYHYPEEISYHNLEVTDQSLGAAIVWGVGGIVFTWTAVLLMRSWLQEEDDKPALPESIWASEEMMLAPGFGRTSSYLSPKK